MVEFSIECWNDLGSIYGQHLFCGHDTQVDKHTTRAHLADVIAALGPPPPLDLISRGKRSRNFFADDGTWIADVNLYRESNLEQADMLLEGDNKKLFMAFVRGMLQWRPEDRKTAWLNNVYY